MRTNPVKRKPLPKVLITDRDTELFEALHNYGVMTRTNIQDCFVWDCVSDVNRRLRKLFDAGYLNRQYLPRKFGPTPVVYSLGSEAVRVLEGRPKISKHGLMRRFHRFRNLSDSLLPHELLITDFAALLKSSLRRYPGCQISDWKNDDDILEKCNMVSDGGDLLLKPDAYGSYHLHKVLYNFFLEADLGTESMSRIQKKVELYRSFKASGLYMSRFGRQAFRLFIVTTSTPRAKNISQVIPQVHDLKIFVGDINSIRIDPLFAPAWLMPAEAEIRPLHVAAELTPGKGLR